MRAGLRLAKEREAKVAALRAALDEAEQSGEPGTSETETATPGTSALRDGILRVGRFP